MAGPKRIIPPLHFADWVNSLVPALEEESCFAVLLRDVRPGRVSLLDHPLFGAYLDIKNAVEQITRAVFDPSCCEDEHKAAIPKAGLAPRIRTELLPAAVQLGDFGIARYRWVGRSPTPEEKRVAEAYGAAGYVIRSLEPRMRKPPKNGFTPSESQLMRDLLRRSIENWDFVKSVLIPWPGSDRWYGSVVSGEIQRACKAHRKLTRFFDAAESRP